MKAHIIGIAGPSSSGKTVLARQLAASLPGTEVVSLDSYYRPLDGMPVEERAKRNFDDPASLDGELLREHLAAIAAGRAFDEPVYSFAEHTRTAQTRRIEPSPYLIVEGLFVLYWPELRAILDTKVYVRTGLEVCLGRRIKRDVAERGRTPQSVIAQYETTVRPAAEQFVIPTQQFADLIVSGEEHTDKAMTLVLDALKRATATAGGR